MWSVQHHTNTYKTDLKPFHMVSVWQHYQCSRETGDKIKHLKSPCVSKVSDGNLAVQPAPPTSPYQPPLICRPSAQALPAGKQHLGEDDVEVGDL